MVWVRWALFMSIVLQSMGEGFSGASAQGIHRRLLVCAATPCEHHCVRTHSNFYPIPSPRLISPRQRHGGPHHVAPPRCPLLVDSANRKACSAAALNTACSTAGTFARMCGDGYTGVKEYKCMLSAGKPPTASWVETSSPSVCTGIAYRLSKCMCQSHMTVSLLTVYLALTACSRAAVGLLILPHHVP